MLARTSARTARKSPGKPSRGARSITNLGRRTKEARLMLLTSFCSLRFLASSLTFLCFVHNLSAFVKGPFPQWQPVPLSVASYTSFTGQHDIECTADQTSSKPPSFVHSSAMVQVHTDFVSQFTGPITRAMVGWENPLALRFSSISGTGSRKPC